MLSSANFLGSDAITIDLEDSVAPGEKDAARILVRSAIQTFNYDVCYGIRINSLDTPFWKADLRELLPLNPEFIMLPKTADKFSILTLVAEMEAIEKEFGITNEAYIIALIETAEGLENAYAVAGAHERVKALFLGAEDLTANLCAKRTKEGQEILYARSRLVCAARAAGIDTYDTPFTDVEDIEALKRDAALARQLGFTGKASIHPSHIDLINSCFDPTPEEIAFSLEVMETIERGKKEGKGAVALHGKMIDAPIVARAEYILKLAGGKKQ